MKKNIPALVSLIWLCITPFFALHAFTNNFFVKDVFTKDGLTIKYTGVVKMKHTSESEYLNDINIDLYLASFFVEEVSYKGEKYEGHQLFGYSFPEELFSKITIKGLLIFKENNIEFNTVVSSLKTTPLELDAKQFSVLKGGNANLKKAFDNGDKFKFKILNTEAIDFPIQKDFFSKMIADIATNNATKTTDEKSVEYIRLLIEGNLLLSKNNYKEAYKSFVLAKKYTEAPSFINSKIEIVKSFITKNRTSKYRWANRQPDIVVSQNNKKPNSDKKVIVPNNDQNTKEQKNTLPKLNRGSALSNTQKKQSVTASKRIITQPNPKDAIEAKGELNIVESKIEVITPTDNEIKNTITVKDNVTSNTSSTEKPEANDIVEGSGYDSLSYTQLLKKGSDLLSNKKYKESKAYFEAAKTKVADKTSVNKILASVNSLLKSSEVLKNRKLPITKKPNQFTETTSVNRKKTDVTKVESQVAREKSGGDNDLDMEAFVRSSSIGFIKFKRDEQAVFDQKNNVLIPFGKYEILRYRSGFASIKLKDTIPLKKIECTGKNGEYSWSARIHQNPWKETVIDNNGEYVDEIVKKVEIYVVDNVSLLPFDEVPQRMKDAYKDPNQFTGTDFISAFNLWEKENAKRPDIVARRQEIQAFKLASKNEAYKGADRCIEEVSSAMEEVYNYYKNLGYEIKVNY